MWACESKSSSWHFNVILTAIRKLGFFFFLSFGEVKGQGPVEMVGVSLLLLPDGGLNWALTQVVLLMSVFLLTMRPPKPCVIFNLYVGWKEYVTHCQPFCNSQHDNLVHPLSILVTYSVTFFGLLGKPFFWKSHVCLWCAYSTFTYKGKCLLPSLANTHIYKGCLTHGVAQCGRTVIPILVKRVVMKRRKGLGGCHLNNGNGVQEVHQHCRRSSFLSLTVVIRRMQSSKC